MQKIFLWCLSFGILASAIGGSAVFAADTKHVPPEGTVFDGPGLDGGVETLKPILKNTGIETQSTLTQAILYWTRILLIVAGIVAFVSFVWAGVLFITSFGNEENQGKAKKILIYTGVGIIVILLSYAMTNFFINATI